jgi:hypothetical protein
VFWMMFVTLYNSEGDAKLRKLESLGKCVIEFEAYRFHVRLDKKNKNLSNNRIYDVDLGG